MTSLIAHCFINVLYMYSVKNIELDFVWMVSKWKILMVSQSNQCQLSHVIKTDFLKWNCFY